MMKSFSRSFAAALFCATAFTNSLSAQEKAPGELVVNSGFEDSTLGAPANWSGVPFVTTASSASQKDQFALKIESPDASYEPLAGQNIFNFEAGKPYRLQYDVRADRFGVEYRAYLGLWKDAAKDAPSGTPASEWIDGVDTDWRQGNTAWQRVSVDFVTTDKFNRIMVVLQMKGPGAVWFDNVSITPHNLGDEKIAAPETGAPVVDVPKNEIVADGDRGVKITADRRFILDGKPFFPIQIWGWTPYTDEAMKTAHDWGFNIVSTPALREYGPQATRAWMDAAQRNNVRAMIAMAFNLPPDNASEWLPAFTKQLEPLMPILRDHPALFGYNINDEPAWAGYDAAAHNAAAQWIKSQDALHPIFVNHAPRNTIEDIKKYNPFIDISGSDIYPVWDGGPDKHSDLPNKTLSVVGDETRKNLEAVDYKKPVMQTLQGFNWSDGTSVATAPKGNLFPTRAQSRFMAWDSIVAGATGVAWFQDERYKVLRPELKPIVHEFASLQDVLANGEIVKTDGVFAAPIQSMAWKHNGKTVLVAINPTDKAIQIAPNWKSVAGSTPGLRVLWENRDSAAQETFAAFDVHLYTDAKTDAEILRPGFEVPTIAK